MYSITITISITVMSIDIEIWIISTLLIIHWWLNHEI